MKTLPVIVLTLVCFGALAIAPAYALTISPTKVEVSVDPGQTLIGEIELFNEEQIERTFFTSFENFEPRGETGSPYFVGKDKGLATWLGAQGSVTLAPGERAEVAYSITVPTGVEPGGYFAAVFFGNQPDLEMGAGEVAIGGKVGVLILLRVNGEVEESGGLLDFSTVPDQFIFTQTPIALSFRFNNTGGDRVVPLGTVTVTNMFGGIVHTGVVNESAANVLPSSTRRIDATWGNITESLSVDAGFFDTALYQFSHFRLGLYRVSIALSWGETKQTAQSSLFILVFPWQLMGLVIFSVLLLYVGLRQYNKMIIARAK